MKLLVAVASNRDWKFDFGCSFFDLGVYLMQERIEFARYCLDNCSNLCFGRQSAVFRAINEGFTHLLFLDDDMGFHIHAVQSVLSRDKDFVAANYLTKSETPKPTVVGIDGKRISSARKTGIEWIKNSGLGFALIKVSLLKAMVAPHFTMTMSINPVTKKAEQLSEDKFFCYKAAEYGGELYVDHDASKFVFHVGKKRFQE